MIQALIIMQHLIKNKLGLTLIEVVVALGVVTTGVIAGLTLTIFNLNTAQSSETRLVAANLAREGLEVIRQKRDSNWLAGNVWNQGLMEAGQYRLTVNFDESVNKWSTASQTVDIENCNDCRIYINAASGVYSHNNTGTLPTSYKRWLGLKEICWQEAIASETVLAYGQECADFNQPLAGYEAEVLVTWTENSRDHSLSAVDRLYDWR